MNIEEIPITELLEDKAASISDIELCKFALLHGIGEYSGGSVIERLEKNQEIIKVIDKELERRNFGFLK